MSAGSKYRYLWAVVLAVGCAGVAREELDLRGPRLVQLSLPDHAVSPTASLVLQFSEAIDQDSIDGAVVVVPYELEGACTVDLDCESPARCHHRTCQRERVTEAWLGDMSRPPLRPSRQAATAMIRWILEPQGQRLVGQPMVPLSPHRLHTLVIGALRGVDGNRVVLPDAGAVARTFATGDPGEARPTVALVSPGPGTTGLPINLRRVVLQFSREVSNVSAETLWLEQERGGRIAAWVQHDASLCADQPPGCHVLRLTADLTPLAEVKLRASNDIHDQYGRRLLALVAPRFAAGESADRSPAAIDISSRISDQCLVARIAADEAVDLELRVPWLEEEVVAVGVRARELALPVPQLAAGVVQVNARDLAGNLSRTETHQPRWPDLPVARVVITEVLANPIGAEPAQEWVELRNLSASAVQLGGWTIDDGNDGVGVNVLAEAILQPGQRAVAVGRGYVEGGVDPAPPKEAVLLRVEKTLGSLGLKNDGELIVLRDAEGRLVSTYGGYHGGGADGVSVERIDHAGCDIAANWRRGQAGRSSPGW